MDKRKCCACKHRGDVIGSSHSTCEHPVAKAGREPLGHLLSMVGGNRVGPQIAVQAAATLGIKANAHGVRMGWFNWPYNFDPVWLDHCDGFEEKIVRDETERPTQ